MALLKRCALAAALAAGLTPLAALAAGPAGAELHTEAMTSPELAARVSAGATTVLLPIGGTEQNGPHMVLGKHNRRVQLLSGLIARQLGQALVAPVLAYVPEGDIDPAQAHMRFAGTITVPETAFEAVLESAARSFRRHGFTEVVFVPDHGGYLKSVQRVATRLNAAWASAPASATQPKTRALALTEYYRASVQGHAELLRGQGFAAAEIGSHAGLADTALTLALDPTLVRADQTARAAQAAGVTGDPQRATAALGQLGVDLVVSRSVGAIRSWRGRP